MLKLNGPSLIRFKNMQKLPVSLYSAAQIRELERIAIHERGIPGFALMSTAGHETFQCMQAKWPKAKSVAVMCGSGNNAGDGYIVARLALEAGLEVRVYSLSATEKLEGDALTAYQKYVNAKGTVLAFQSEQAINAEVIVDALLGTGLDRPVTGMYALAVQTINKCSAPVIAVDIPSGLNADTGAIMGGGVKADCTVTFIGLKQGLFTGHAAEYCGEIIYSSLAVPDDVFKEISSSVYRIVKDKLPRRNRCAHKGDYGKVLIVGGDKGYSGAARLAGEAALRMGSGLVSIATRTEHAGLMNLNRPELMCHGVETADQLKGLLDSATVVVMGPGLGQSDWAKALWRAVIQSGKHLVIDADALNILAASAESPDSSLRFDHGILTPHPGEAARLLNCSTAEIQQDRFAAVLAIQAKYGGIVILKGAGTLVASEHTVAIAAAGNPGMASGGMGDVLSGVIAGLMAQQFSLQYSAQQGVYLHALAADLAAINGGERGLLASDLMPYLRQVVNE